MCGRFITNRSARASKDHRCIFGLQTSSHHTAIARCKLRQDKRTRARQQARNIEKGDREREKKANAKEALERVDYPIYLYVLSFLSKSESIITPVCIEVLLQCCHLQLQCRVRISKSPGAPQKPGRPGAVGNCWSVPRT